MKRALARLARLTLSALLGAAALTAPAVAWAFDVVAQVITPALVELRVGETRNVAIEIVVKPGHHVQANPAAQPFLIPTALTLASAPGVTMGTPRYPAPKRLRLAGSGEELLVYDRRFAIVVPITGVQRGAAPVRLAGSLSYQGCDDRRCFFPRVTPIAPIALVVGGDAARPDGARRGTLAHPAHPAHQAAKADRVRIF